MPNTKITALNELTTTPASDDVLAIVDISSNETKKIKVSTLGTGGGGSGTVTSVALTAPAALSVSGSPITTSGTIAISGAGTTSQFIDGTGALQTTPTGTVTGVTGTAPIVSSGGAAPAISITASTTSAAGSMSAADKTKLDSIATGAEVNTVDDVTGGTGLTASPTTGNVVVNLDSTAVTAGSYTNADITVDAQGRLTSAANGSSGSTGTVTNVATGTGLTGGPITTTGTISIATNGVTNTQLADLAVGQSNIQDEAVGNDALEDGAVTSSKLANTAVTAGSYTSANITVDAQGRLTAAANGAAGGVTSVTGTSPIVSSGGSTPAISIAQASNSTAGSMSAADFIKLGTITTAYEETEINTGQNIIMNSSVSVTSDRIVDIMGDALADTSNANSKKLIGFHTGSGVCVLQGMVDAVNAINGATAGGPLWIGASGVFSSAAPTTTNYYSRVVGYFVGTGQGGEVICYFDPSKDWVQIS